MILYLGEDVVPYEEEDKTTLDVALALEREYHLMEAFYNFYENDIKQDLSESMEERLEALFSGAPTEVNLFAGLGGKIEERFKEFISSYTAEGIGIRGTPTKAALAGVSSRFKKKFGPRRPSFLDTGDYMAHFRAWLEED